jgi:hypothetical protein
MNPRTLKVAVSLTITVDLDEYAEAYGSEDRESIRESVRYAAADGVSAVLSQGIARVQINR